jgi:hypothetical protein
VASGIKNWIELKQLHITEGLHIALIMIIPSGKVRQLAIFKTSHIFFPFPFPISGQFFFFIYYLEFSGRIFEEHMVLWGN